MFWKYNTNNSNHIDQLLNKPNVTLQELMDKEDILQECKAQNQKLVEFLCRPEIMEQLVTFATVDPPIDLEESIRFKYPNIACELLTCDNTSINEHLASTEPLKKLYAFLKGKPPLNPLLASFFSKILGSLVARKIDQNWYSYQLTCLNVLLFLQSEENCIPLLLTHLGTSAIMDLMLKLITQVEGTDTRQNLVDWLEAQRVLPSLIALLRPEIDSDRHSTVSQLLSDIIRKSRENDMHDNSFIDPDPTLVFLEKQETVSELLEHMLSGEKRCETAIVGGIGVLLTLIEIPSRDNVVSFPPFDCDPTKEEESPPLPPVVHTTLAAILPRLKDFHDTLLNPPQKPPVKTTVTTLDPPLGNTRLQITRLVAALIALNNPTINQELASLGTMEVLLDLFFNYPWNNFLHTQVELCIASILRHQTKASGDGDPQLHCLVENLLVKCELMRRILDAWEENETNQLQTKSPRRGYMGHLIGIATHVVNQIENCSLRPILAKQLPPEVLAVWEEFAKCTLSEINKTHSLALGGAPPTQSIGLEKEEANYKQDAFLPDKILRQDFFDYQLQEMEPSFTENYGFHDNEFNDPEDTLHSSVDRSPDMAVALNEDVDRQYEWFKYVCAKNVRSLEDAEENAWEDANLGSFQTSENEARKIDKEGPEHSSSDEEEEDNDKEESEVRRPTKTDVRMDVDVNDIWSSGAATLDTIADFQNPWGSGPPTGQPSDAFGPSEGDWADFSSFETNFSSSTQLNDAKKSQDASALFGDGGTAKANADDLKIEEKASLPESGLVSDDVFASTSETAMKDMQTPDLVECNAKPDASAVSFVEADANANPTTRADDVTSTATAMVDEVATAAVAAVRVVVADKLGLDNQRFLGVAEDKSDASPSGQSEEAACEPVVPDEKKEQREVDSSVSEDLPSETV